MSRLAIHQGMHIHPERKVFCRESFNKVKEVLGKHHSANPTATSSRLKNISIGDILFQVQEGSADGLTKEDEKELWDTMGVIATPSKFMSLLQTVRRDSPLKGNGIFECLWKMQETTIVPYIQRYRVTGQGSASDFSFISKCLSRKAAPI
jgi:hypothetical protein